MLTRIISALVMAVVVASVVLWAPVNIFNLIILLIILGGLHEFLKLTLPLDRIYRYSGLLFGAAVAATLCFYDFDLFLPVVIFGLFVLCLIYMKRATTFEGAFARIGVTLFGVIYLAATLPFFAFLRELPNGKALVFMALAGAAMSDTFALFTGKSIGKHKFAPLTSPNKTMEGFIGGFVGSIFAVFVVKFIGWRDLSNLHCVLIGLVIGFFGPFGDLIESMIKRDVHVKDSGNLIPGHGGLLDRLDAMIFVGPVLYFYAKMWLI